MIDYDGHHILIRYIADSPDRQTGIWDVVTKDEGAILGWILWDGAQRKYCFSPIPHAGETCQTCLRDIVEFCERATRKHRRKRRNG